MKDYTSPTQDELWIESWQGERAENARVLQATINTIKSSLSKEILSLIEEKNPDFDLESFLDSIQISANAWEAESEEIPEFEKERED